MIIPGMNDLLKQLRELEDHARAYRLGQQRQMVPLTQEEVDVVESYRRFLAEDYA